MGAGIRFDHLASLTTSDGLYEHALHARPRVEHGMCVDDVARALVVVARHVHSTPDLDAMASVYLAFLVAAQCDDGSMHNRRSAAGAWLDAPSTGDHWGRALWAFGTAATYSSVPGIAAAARVAAGRALRARSRWPRAIAYATLGASLILDSDPDDAGALLLLRDARRVLGRARMDRSWPWPEDALTYANAVLPEAMLVTGRQLDIPDLRDDGRYLLRWLIEQQTVGDHLSPVPVGGRRRGEPPAVGFDQQPIEIAAIAEACHTAYRETGDGRWLTWLTWCVAWFDGHNDAGLVMYDPATGGGYDGLHAASVNQNQGAESTLAWLATQQVSSLRVMQPAIP